jgi:hypothetical protein
MAQLTIYIDDETLRRIEKSSRQEHSSVSSWVRKRLTASLNSGWPAGYFETFSSLKSSGLERPVQISAQSDRKRAEL